MTIQAPTGPWLPDLPTFENQGSTEVLNCVPKLNSYGPFPSFAATSQTLDDRALGAFFARKNDGSGIIIAGDKAKLYEISATAVVDLSRTSQPYTTPNDGHWTFLQFGSLVIATNGHNHMQAHNIDTGTRFGDISGAPYVLYACVAGDFVMTGNQEPAADMPRLVQWSAINNAVDYATSQATQASRQDLPDGGAITGLVGLEYAAIVFQMEAIRIASYIGPPLIFRFDRISNGLGCDVPGSIANYKDLIFFCDRSGFYLMQGATPPQPIGAQQVNNTFWGLVDQSNLARVCAAIDAVNSLYVIGFPDTSATNGDVNHLFIYHWGLGRWAHVHPGNLDIIFNAIGERGYTLEGLDNVSTNLDLLPASLDAARWRGTPSGLVGGFDTSHALGFFNGPSLAATVDTTEQNIIPGKRAFLRSVRPLFDDGGSAASVALGIRNRLNDAVTFGTPVTQNGRGLCKFSSGCNARYHRGRITVPAGANWQFIQGLTDIMASPMGQR